MTQNNPSEPNRTRAADADRDAVAQQLNEALAQGRLDIDEHNERLEATYRAKTLGELVPLTEDLPTGPESAPSSQSRYGALSPSQGGKRVVSRAPTSRMAFALLGGTDRSGPWTLPGTFVAGSVLGGIDLDLRNAAFTKRETTIWCGTVMGGMEITVPHDVQVRVHGLPVMGSFGLEADMPDLGPDAPIVHVRGFAVMGGVEVKYRSWDDDDDDE